MEATAGRRIDPIGYLLAPFMAPTWLPAAGASMFPSWLAAAGAAVFGFHAWQRYRGEPAPA